MTNDTTAHRAAAALDDAVDGAYLAFSRHRGRPWSLDICDHCCVSESTARRLFEEPPAHLNSSDLQSYNGSAKSEVQDPAEVGHFLPRMLALLAQDEPVHHSLEIALDRLGGCPADCWNAQERAAIDRFAIAYFDAVLFGPLAHRRSNNPLSVLLMFDFGGVSIAPLLRRWQDCDHPCATIQYVRATYWDFWKERCYSNAFADKRPRFMQQLHDWLVDADCRRRFAERLTRSDFLAAAQHERAGGFVPFALMAEAVFDELTS
jgi:hypothetical protein